MSGHQIGGILPLSLSLCMCNSRGDVVSYLHRALYKAQKKGDIMFRSSNESVRASRASGQAKENGFFLTRYSPRCWAPH